MQICTNCAAKQLDGTIFCDECGAAMTLGPATSVTRMIAVSDEKSAPAPIVFEPIPAPFCLQVLPSGKLLHYDGRTNLIIGRSSHSNGHSIDIDLHPVAAMTAGVSRRHARLIWASEGYLLSDLGSTNGTAINGRDVQPEEATPLRDGDELRFGFLTVQFREAAPEIRNGQP